MALGSEFTEIMQLLGTPQANTAIPIRLVLPAMQASILLYIYKLQAYIIPEQLIAYTVSTSTEMMKDRKAIDTVV